MCVSQGSKLVPPLLHFFQERKHELESQCQSHGPIKCTVGIVAAVVLLLAVTQTTLLLVQTYVLPRTCETQINSSDCAAERATELDNRSIYFQVIEILRITFSFMTLPEYAVLIHGLYKLLIKTSNAVHHSSKRPSLDTTANLRKLFEDLRANKVKHYRAWMGIFLASVFTIIFALFSLATPIMDIAHAFIVNKCYPDCKEQQLILIFTVV